MYTIIDENFDILHTNINICVTQRLQTTITTSA